MKKRKSILIVSRSFYPLNSPRSFRTTELAKEFARQGHEVTVITPKVDEHKKFEETHNLKIKDLGQPKWKAVELKEKGVNLLFRRAVKRFFNLLFEYPAIELMWMVEKALRKEKERYDLLISIAVPYPIHWGVAKVWSKDSNKNPANVWVADCGDPYMGQENDTFTPPFYFGWVEKWFMRKADYISVPVETAIPAYYPEFHHKIEVIPQGFRFEDVQIQEYSPKNECPHFAYAGGFIQGRRDPREILEYLNSLDQDFRFDIYTRQIEMVKPYAEKSGGRIQIKDYIPRKQLLNNLSQCDFLVNFENVGSKQIPSKLIDYALLDKPILSIETGNLDREKIDQFLNGNYESRLVVENVEQYRIENVVERFLQLTETETAIQLG